MIILILSFVMTFWYLCQKTPLFKFSMNVFKSCVKKSAHIKYNRPILLRLHILSARWVSTTTTSKIPPHASKKIKIKKIYYFYKIILAVGYCDWHKIGNTHFSEISDLSYKFNSMMNQVSAILYFQSLLRCMAGPTAWTTYINLKCIEKNSHR